MASIAQLSATQTNFAWTNTSTSPQAATVEIQFDGLAGSGVINLSTVATVCSSLGPLNDNATSGNSATAAFPVNISTLASTNLPAVPYPTANSSLVSYQSTNAVIPPVSATSASSTLSTGVGVLSRSSAPNILTWLILGLLPAALVLAG
jgi:hypothetical protein